jgi:hypothetical protein
MASERQNMSDQEISIKAREHELYVRASPKTDPKPVKPFPVYLRETPAEPLSPTTKVILWTVGIVVAMLFLASLWRVSHRPPTKPSTRTAPSESKAAMF